MARMSSASRLGENGPPTLVTTRPRITASWTRRFPWMERSLTMICRPGSGGVCAAAGGAGRGGGAKKMERKILPRRVRRASGPSYPGPAFGGSVLGQRERRLCDLRFPEDEIISLHVELEARPIRDLAADDGLGERVLHVLLDGTPELPGAVSRVVPLLHEEIEGRRGGLHRDALVGQLGVHPLHHEADDVGDVLAGEAVEHDGVVDAVDELRPERALELLHDPALHLLVGGIVALGDEAGRYALADEARPEVRRHDQDGVL